MSSRSTLGAPGLTLVDEHESVGLALSVAAGETPQEVVMAATRATDLADCDAMKGGVDLAIAPAVESVPLLVAGRGWYGRGAVMHGKSGAGAKATGISGLAYELGGGQNPTPGKCQQARRQRGHHGCQLPLELIDSKVQLHGSGSQLPGQLSHQARTSIEKGFDSLNSRPPTQRPRGDLEPRLQFVKQPLQSILHSSSLADEILAMVEKQPHFARVLLQMRLRQVGFAERSACDSQCINGVRLAPLAHAAPAFCSHMRWYSHDDLAHAEKVFLKTSSHVTTVLNGPTPLRPTLRPAQDIEVARRCCCHGVRTQLPPGLVYSYHRMAPLVRVGAQCHHSLVSFFRGALTGRRTRLSWGKPISYQATQAGLLLDWQRQVQSKATPPCAGRARANRQAYPECHSGR